MYKSTDKGHKDEVQSVVLLINIKGEFTSASIDKIVQILLYNNNPEIKGHKNWIKFFLWFN